MTPSIDVAKNISNHLNTTVGYLLGETDRADLFKDTVMLQRLAELDKIENTEKSHILHVLDGFIKSVKLKNIAALKMTKARLLGLCCSIKTLMNLSSFQTRDTFLRSVYSLMHCM